MSGWQSRKRRHKSKEKQHGLKTPSELDCSDPKEKKKPHKLQEDQTQHGSRQQQQRHPHQQQQTQDSSQPRQRSSESALLLTPALTSASDQTAASQALPVNKKESKIENVEIKALVATGIQELSHPAGQDSGSVAEDGNAVLHLCTAGAYKDGVAYLIDKGAQDDLTNNLCQLPLHAAASLGHLEVCERLLSCSTTEAAPGLKILSEDGEAQTPVCRALTNQHLSVVKLLMEACSNKEALDYYLKTIQKLNQMSASEVTSDVQPILASLTFVVKKLQKEHMSEMCRADPMPPLVRVIRHCHNCPKVLSTACLLISVLVWGDTAETYSVDSGSQNPYPPEAEFLDNQNTLIQQFLNCQGPEAVMEKLHSQIFTAHDTYLMVSTLLPIMILASRPCGRVWLEQNSSHLSYYKQLLTQNKSFITHLGLSHQQGLAVGQVMKTFLSFVEDTEAKDREQNLVQLLEEEERDRIKRERKKRKQQKKQNKQSKVKVATATTAADAEASSDEESAECHGWEDEPCVESERPESGQEKSEQTQLFYPVKQKQPGPHVNQSAEQSLAQEPYSLRPDQRFVKSHGGNSTSSFILPDQFSGTGEKWQQVLSAPEDFPPISTTPEEVTSPDANDGWVKVENRKQSLKSLSRQHSASVILRPIKKPETVRPSTPMRWADVARIGCCREGNARNMVALTGRYPGSDYYKMSVMSRNTAGHVTPELGASRSLADGEGDDWQELAGGHYTDTSACKQMEEESDIVLRSSCSSDCESDALSSTLSSECPSGQSEGMQGRKIINAVAEFERPDTSVYKNIFSDKEEYPVRNTMMHGDPRQIKSFIFNNSDHAKDIAVGFMENGSQRVDAKQQIGQEAMHCCSSQPAQTAWSRAEAKPAVAFSHIWGTTCRSKTLEVLGQPRESLSERNHPLQRGSCKEVELTVFGNFRDRVTTPSSMIAEATEGSMSNGVPLTSFYNPNSYYIGQPGQTLSRCSGQLGQHAYPPGNDVAHKQRPPYAISFQKTPVDRPGPQCQCCLDYSHDPGYRKSDRPAWLPAETRDVDIDLPTTWDEEVSMDTSVLCQLDQQPSSCFMPSFASMSSAVDNNPIVTSVVESVLTPAVISQSSLAMQNPPLTYSGKTSGTRASPAFKQSKPTPMRVMSSFDQTSFASKNHIPTSNFTQPEVSTFLQSDNCAYDPFRPMERQLLFHVTRSRSDLSGFAGAFPKTLTGSDDSLLLQQQHPQHQHHQHQHQQMQQQPPQQRPTHYYHQVSNAVFSHGPLSPGVHELVLAECREGHGPTSLAMYDLPTDSIQSLLSGDANTESWSERLRPSSYNNIITIGNQPHLYNPSTSSPGGPNPVDFPSLLGSRLHQRQNLRYKESPAVPQLRRVQVPVQNLQGRSFLEATDGGSHRLYGDTQAGPPPRLASYLAATVPQPSHRMNLRSVKAAATTPQSKLSGHLHQQANRGQLQSRPPTPPVLFPSDLRDVDEPGERSYSPPFPDLTGTDLFSDLFTDPLLVERIAINQIRQQVLASQASSMMPESAASSLRDSVYLNDLEYYASLYRLKLKDLLLFSTQPDSTSGDMTSSDRPTGVIGSRPDQDKARTSCPRTQQGPGDNQCPSPQRDSCGERLSRRWRDSLNKILDTSWTMRRQFGDIILPHTWSEFNISQVEYPLVLGFTTDGCQVAVLILNKSQAYVDPDLLDIMCDPELDHHFILKCKGMSETYLHEYIALDLCDYTLAEYMQIVQLSHHQDPLSANRLAWQLLEGLRFIHHTLNMPHGNLKPSWIFVDLEGRLRLAGYGIVTKQTSSSAEMTASSSEKPKTGSGQEICWTATEDLNVEHPQPSMAADIQVAGMLLYFIMTGGQHPYGSSPLEVELNLGRQLVHMDLTSDEANDLVSGMLFHDPTARPTIQHCLKHPFFWSSEKKFRLILIVGSDVLTEMKTGIALTGNGSLTMTEILSVIDIAEVSLNWVQAINPTVMKEMRSFRVYKNSLSELTLFIYNCCLHFDKMSGMAKEMLDDPCKYFQALFPSLFMAIYRSLKASDRTDRTCYKPFFS